MRRFPAYDFPKLGDILIAQDNIAALMREQHGLCRT